MENKVIETVRQYNMLCKGDDVVIGLSGGADSVALLHFLLSVREQYDLTITACHVNHMLRGEEADRDEEFVRKLCSRYGIRFELLRADVAGMAASRHESTELVGREVRYSFFERIADESNAKIATAHTASDNAETILLYLTRGCGIRGLCGIPPVRGRIIRPLIDVTRQEIEQYCHEKGLSYVTDSSNLANDYSRNKLRHDVIPVLKEINPAFEKCASRLSELSRNNLYTINRSAAELLDNSKCDAGYKVEMLYDADEAVFAEAMHILCEPFGISLQYRQIALLNELCLSGGELELKKQIYAVSKQGSLRIIKKKQNDRQVCDPVPVKGLETLVINDKKFRVVKMKIGEFHNRKKTDKFFFYNALDYGTIPVSGVFRNRMSGDKFRIPGRGLTKTVRKLFVELKIPYERRDEIVLLADKDRVLWIEGIGACEECRVSTGTQEVLVLIPEMS